jgi:D-alanyl-D-alanine carboxypeptidase
LISSVIDLVKWDGALREGRLFTETSLEQMWSPVILNDQTTSPYGFGWFIRSIPSHRTVAHGGGLPGFSSFIWRFMDDKLTAVLLANSEKAETAKISLHVAGFYRPVLMTPEIKKQL